MSNSCAYCNKPFARFKHAATVCSGGRLYLFCSNGCRDLYAEASPEGIVRIYSSQNMTQEELRALVPSLQEEAAQALEGSMDLMSYFFLSFVIIFFLLIVAVFIRLLLTDREAVEIDLQEVEAESEKKGISQPQMKFMRGFNEMALPFWFGNLHYIL